MNDTTDVEKLLQTKIHPRDRHLFGPGPKRLLSFDGGGVRGAISVAFLERIEQIFARHQKRILTDFIAEREQSGVADEKLAAARKKLDEPFRLGDWFDLVGGTSTGALIAGAIALGFSTEQIKDFYTKRAAEVFKRPFWRIPGLQAKFDARLLQQEIDRIVGLRTLDSEDLITGLSVVAKRMDTGSPWILTNNPQSPYWDNSPDFIGNRHYKLATLVRASTAAPHFFDPEIVQILAEEEKPSGALEAGSRGFVEWLNNQLTGAPRLSMLLTRLRAIWMSATPKGRDARTRGLFVDGGVTPYNNPSLALLMQVVLKPYKICWPLGPDSLTFVSIGTGSYRTRVSFEELGWSRNIKLALNSLMSVMGDTQVAALTMMQWLGECPAPWTINSEVKTLADDMPPGHHWFRFMRYDLGLDQQWFRAPENLGLNLSEEVIASYRNMDDPAIIPILYEHAAQAALKQVKPEHFFPERKADPQAAGLASA